MSRSFEIDLAYNEGALMRVLGTVERRGFAVVELRADKPDAESYAIHLLLDGERDPHVLCRQLERLVDVRAVRVLPEPPEPLLPPGFQATWL